MIGAIDVWYSGGFEGAWPKSATKRARDDDEDDFGSSTRTKRMYRVAIDPSMFHGDERVLRAIRRLCYHNIDSSEGLERAAISDERLRWALRHDVDTVRWAVHDAFQAADWYIKNCADMRRSLGF